jgi:hypothetical protein
VIAVVDNRSENLAEAKRRFPKAFLIRMLHGGYVAARPQRGDYNLDRPARRRDRGVLMTFERPRSSTARR